MKKVVSKKVLKIAKLLEQYYLNTRGWRMVPVWGAIRDQAQRIVDGKEKYPRCLKKLE